MFDIVPGKALPAPPKEEKKKKDKKDKDRDRDRDKRDRDSHSGSRGRSRRRKDRDDSGSASPPAKKKKKSDKDKDRKKDKEKDKGKEKDRDDDGSRGRRSLDVAASRSRSGSRARRKDRRSPEPAAQQGGEGGVAAQGAAVEPPANGVPKVPDWLSDLVQAPGAGARPPQPSRREVMVPQQLVARLIGKGGEVIMGICSATGADVRIRQETKDMGYSLAVITGHPDAAEKAEIMVMQKLGLAASGVPLPG